METTATLNNTLEVSRVNETAPKDSVVVSAAAEWRCGICCVTNGAASHICECCEAPKPSPNGDADADGPKFLFGAANNSSAFITTTESAVTTTTHSALTSPPSKSNTSDGSTNNGAKGFMPSTADSTKGFVPSATATAKGGFMPSRDAAVGEPVGFVFGSTGTAAAGDSVAVGFKPTAGGTGFIASTTNSTTATLLASNDKLLSAAGAADGLSNKSFIFGAAPSTDDVPVYNRHEDDIEDESEDEYNVKGLKKVDSLAVDTSAEGTGAQILVWGTGECDQLPIDDDDLDDDMSLPEPTLPQSLSVWKQVKSVSCGALHSLALMHNGSVVSWGCNDDSALGRSGNERMPDLVELIESAVAISCGDSHSACITKDGDCFSWGSYKDSAGHIGFPMFDPRGVAPKVSAPKKMEFEVDCTVHSLASGENHTAVLVNAMPNVLERLRSRTQSANKLELIIWGNSEFGQLGIPPVEGVDDNALSAKHDRLFGTRHTTESLGLVDAAFTRLFSGGGTTFVITSEPLTDDITGSHASATAKRRRKASSSAKTAKYRTRVLGCGRNANGEVGLGMDTGADGMTDDDEVQPYDEATAKTSLVTKFEELRSLRDKPIARLAGGQFFTAMLAPDGEVYSWGLRDFVCQGRQQQHAVYTPTRIDGFSGVEAAGAGKAVDLGVGPGTGFVTTDKGLLFVWGDTQLHQLGLGRATEEPLTNLHALPPSRLHNKFVKFATGGAQHSIAVFGTSPIRRRRRPAKTETSTTAPDVVAPPAKRARRLVATTSSGTAVPASSGSGTAVPASSGSGTAVPASGSAQRGTTPKRKRAIETEANTNDSVPAKRVKRTRDASSAAATRTTTTTTTAAAANNKATATADQSKSRRMVSQRSSAARSPSRTKYIAAAAKGTLNKLTERSAVIAAAAPKKASSTKKSLTTAASNKSKSAVRETSEANKAVTTGRRKREDTDPSAVSGGAATTAVKVGTNSSGSSTTTTNRRRTPTDSKSKGTADSITKPKADKTSSRSSSNSSADKQPPRSRRGGGRQGVVDTTTTGSTAAPAATATTGVIERDGGSHRRRRRA